MNNASKYPLVFVNRFFWPDISATSQILTDLAFALGEQGYDVHVITSRLSYDDPTARFAPSEKVRGVTIHRVRTSGFGKTHLIGKAADFLSFYINALLKVMCFGYRTRFIVKTDPPLLSIPLALIIRLRGGKLYNWLQDVYPEVASALGIKQFDGFLGRLLRQLRNASLRQAECNIVIGEKMEELLAKEGVAPQRIAVIHNWTDDQVMFPDPVLTQAMREAWGFTNAMTVVGYSGNLGRAHDLDTMIASAIRLRDAGQDHVRFLFVGGGHLRDMLQTRIVEYSLTSIVCQPYQPRENLPQSLAVPDIHWMSLLPEMEGLIVPSKFYGAAASGKPILFVGDQAGQLAQMIADGDMGATVAIGDSKGMADQLLLWADNCDLRRRQGLNARAAIEKHYRKERSIAIWRDILNRT